MEPAAPAAHIAHTLRMTTPLGGLELVAQAGELITIRISPTSLAGRQTASDGDADRQTAWQRGSASADGPAAAPADAADAAANDAADAAVLARARRQLDAYFAGKSDSFSLPTRSAGTAFQLAVWDALRAVGYGETTTYGELAVRIGRPRATRAVGQALARNPLPIVVPCHRVVGHQGGLTGFGGGIDRKRLLLELEKR